jgi:hypothetical protein
VRHDGESAATSLVGGSGPQLELGLGFFRWRRAPVTPPPIEAWGVIRTRWLSTLRRGGGGTASVTGGRRAVGEAGGGGVAGDWRWRKQGVTADDRPRSGDRRAEVDDEPRGGDGLRSICYPILIFPNSILASGL